MRAVRVSWALPAGVVALAGALVSVLLAEGGRSEFDDVTIALAIVVWAIVGLVIELARPGHPVGRLMLFGAAAWGLGEGLITAGLDTESTGMAVVGSAARGMGWLVLVLAVPLVFPDGRAPTARSRHLVIATVATFTSAMLLSPEPLEERLAGADNPFGLPAAWQPFTDTLAVGALALAFGCLWLAVRGLLGRWRSGDELVRQQVLVFALAFAFPLALLPIAASPWVEPWMFALVTLPVPVAIGAAILQRRLYDIQLAVNRTLTYTALTVALAAVYALVVGGVGVVLSDQGAVWLPWAAAGTVAVAFAPLRDALQRTANRITYGRWAAPAEVLAATGRRLADAADAQALLAALTDELVDGLGLERAELRDGHGRVLASAGAGETVDSLPLTAYGEHVGELRWGRHALRDTDRALLTDLSHQLGGVVHTTVLVDDLRAAREQLVLAREQERLRLRRDLHDGLGPSLAGLGLQVDTVQRLLAGGRPVDERLVALRAGLAGTVVEVRRIVDGLRPPALDELGLFEAVAELGRELVAGSGLTLELDLPDRRAALPAAVEVATYRVAQEALTNVVRHAHATACRVWARVSLDLLQLEVSDDGCGGATPSGGLGLGTMHERAGEVGGAVEVRQLERGTAVLLRLPLAVES